MYIKYYVIRLAVALLVVYFTGCENFDDDPVFPASDFISSGDYQGEYWPTEAWRQCAPEEVGMNPKKLKELNEEVRLLMDLHVKIHSVVIVKDGYIVAEQYYSDEYGTETIHPIASCTKSLTSALFGIASGKGLVNIEEDRMVDFFPEYVIENISGGKESITLEHLLTMSPGLEWYEIEYSYSDERNTYRQWIDNGGGVQFVLNRPMVASPGEEYSYNTGASHVLSAVLQKVTGIRADSFAMEHLFQPLGIGEVYWPADNRNVSYGGSAVKMTPRDMARFGYLYLKGGNWDGIQIMPEEWVEKSQQKHIKRKYIEDYYYGYLWWVSDHNTYSAVGYAGQWITIIPEHDLVIIFTNDFEEEESLQVYTPERLIETYILPAVR